MRKAVYLLLAISLISVGHCMETCMGYNTNVANIAAQYASCSGVTTDYLPTLINWSYIFCLNAQKDKQHIKDITIVERRDQNLLAFFLYDQEKDLLVLSFRGTVCGASGANRKTDVNLDFKAYKEWGCKSGNCLVHSGFYDSYNLMKDELRATAKLLVKKYPSAQFMITGVSLGGSLAAIASYDIKMYLKSQGIAPNYLFYTFGQPRMGNSQLVRQINKQLLIYRLIDSADPVPHLPPRKLPASDLIYYHPGVEVYYQDPDSLSFSLCTGDNDRCSLKRKGQYEVCNHLYYPFMNLKGNGCTVRNTNFDLRISQAETLKENKQVVAFFLHECKIACLSMDTMFCPYYRIPELHCEPLEQKQQLLMSLIQLIMTQLETQEMEQSIANKSTMHRVCSVCEFLTSKHRIFHMKDLHDLK